MWLRAAVDRATALLYRLTDRGTGTAAGPPGGREGVRHGRLLLVVAAMLPLAAARAQVPEIYGSGFDGWRLVRIEDTRERVVCRATYNNAYAIERSGAGRNTVSVPQGKVPDGAYPGAVLKVGGVPEARDAVAGGGRLGFAVSGRLLDDIARARGYVWEVKAGGDALSGEVSFNAAAGKAVSLLRECARDRKEH